MLTNFNYGRAFLPKGMKDLAEWNPKKMKEMRARRDRQIKEKQDQAETKDKKPE